MGNRLKELRKEKGVTQAEVAKIINTNQSQYGKYENGKTNLNLETSKILANYFDVSVPYLLGIESEVSNNKPLKNIQGLFKEMSELYRGDYLAVIEGLERISDKTYFNSLNRDRLEEIKKEKEELKKKLVQLESEAEQLRKETSDEIKQIINNSK